MNPSKPTKEGKLKKYRNFLKGWKERYFKLERSYLHYYETQYTAAPIGSITRGDILLVKPCMDFPGQMFVFELHTKTGIIWYLQASSQDEMMSWVRILYPSGYFVDPTTSQPVVSGMSIPPVQPSVTGPGYQSTTTHQPPSGIAAPQGTFTQGPHLQDTRLQGPYPQGVYTQGPYSQGAHTRGSHAQGVRMQSPYPQGFYTQGPYSQGAPTQGSYLHGTHTQGPYSQGAHTEGPYQQHRTEYRLYPQIYGHEGTPPFNPYYQDTEGPGEPRHSSPPPSYEESAQAPPLPSKS